MGIDFSLDRWDRIRNDSIKWWEGKLERPLVQVRVQNRDPGRKMPRAPQLSQANCNDFSYSADEIIDRMDYDLSRYTYLGDDYPSVTLTTFGPGILAAMTGAELDNSSGAVWIHPKKMLPVEEIHLEYDPDNKWLCRIRDICRAAVRRWEGQVLVQMPDLGGNMDILSSFLTTEQLLFELYDHPEEVKRILNEEHNLWFKIFDEINDILGPAGPGYSNWSNIYSDKPSYILQCDFCYMIGPEMFDEFVRPELASSCDRLPRSFYHLDGKGQIPHLDSLLKIGSLDGVQWVPGSGNPPGHEWPELQKKIASSGKLMQIHSSLDNISKTIKNIEGLASPGIIHCRAGIYKDEAEAREKLSALGIE